MYKIKNTERNNEKASDFETFSMLYLLGIRSDNDQIDLVLVDCFNDVTGSDDAVSCLWDVQSKGHKSNTPLQIGEHLVTLYENYITAFPFEHLILFLETVACIHVHDSSLKIFKHKNFTDESQNKIKDGLIREYARRTSIQLTTETIKVDSFLESVEFVVCTKDKVANIKNLIEFKNKDVRDAEFFIEIFNEIRGLQSRLKNTNVESRELNSPIDVLSFRKHITKNQIVALLVNRLVGAELFSNHGIPIDFMPYVVSMDREDAKDLIQGCIVAICRTFFDKNNKVNIWRFLESAIKAVMKDSSIGLEEVIRQIPETDMEGVPTMDSTSVKFLIARIKDGLQ